MPTYRIHDNGGTPFTVSLNGSKVTVTSWSYDWDADKPVKGPVVLETEYQHAWIGKNKRKYEGYYEESGQLGNSILLAVGPRKFIWIGLMILQFELGAGEEVKDFDSPIGNNDVPYPAVYTNKRVLLMIEGVALPIEAVDSKLDPYAQYYGHIGVGGFKKIAKKFKSKTLVKRQW
jgi:hypothetical protein